MVVCPGRVARQCPLYSAYSLIQQTPQGYPIVEPINYARGAECCVLCMGKSTCQLGLPTLTIIKLNRKLKQIQLLNSHAGLSTDQLLISPKETTRYQSLTFFLSFCSLKHVGTISRVAIVIFISSGAIT